MTTTSCAFDRDWSELALAEYHDYSDKITYCRQGEDAFSGYGSWFYAPENPLKSGEYVIYNGTYGNYNSPGADSYTYATLYDDRSEWLEDVKKWEDQPEFVDD